MSLPTRAGVSEDCLYLNVFSRDLRPRARQPVMVWIHGGFFRVGSGAGPAFDGAALTREGVVLVTINYRLDRFGRFAHPALSAEQPGEPVIHKYFADSKPGTAPTLPVAKGAPNVIWILLDDVGFGASSAFGGPARTPVIEQLANKGLRYTTFHTTAVCSACRAVLLPGGIHHTLWLALISKTFVSIA